MDIFDKFNCPQYVNFNSVIDKDDSILKSLEVSPASSSVKDDAECGNMDTQDENSYLQDQSYPDSLRSSLCDSYLENAGNITVQDSPCSVASSCHMEDFPINRPRNISLPENEIKKKKKVNKTTKVQPFHFAELKKRKREVESTETHIPLAEQVAAFHKKTPKRFHTTGPKNFEPVEHWSPTRVVPKSPNLQAAKRQRRIDVISHEEQEEIEIEEMKRYKFRARPLNHKLLNQPHLPQIRKKTPTKAKGLQLKTAQRAAEIHAKRKVEEKPYEFRARPVPKAILEGPVGLKEKHSLPITQPKTPNFALKDRAEKWRSESKIDETFTETQVFKAHPAPAPSAPFVVKHEKKCVIPQPFSFDSYDKERMARKEQKIKEEIEKENVFVFKAQPMPSPTPSYLPQVPKKKPTQPEPFSFLIEERNSKHSSFNSTFQQTCPPVFKAKPATVLEKPPFIPEKPEKQPLEVVEFKLHTDVRASERQKLKEIQDMKEREKELILQKQKEMEEERERREIQKLRKEIVHKANPIRHYKPVEIKPCSIPLTVPMTPKFKTDERLQSKH